MKTSLDCMSMSILVSFSFNSMNHVNVVGGEKKHNLYSFKMIKGYMTYTTFEGSET